MKKKNRLNKTLEVKIFLHILKIEQVELIKKKV